jgi:hypothetical protein
VVTLSLETAPKGYFGNRVFQELRRPVDGELERPGIGPRQLVGAGPELGTSQVADSESRAAGSEELHLSF